MKRLAAIFVVAAAVSGATPLTANAGSDGILCGAAKNTWPLNILPANIPYCE